HLPLDEPQPTFSIACTNLFYNLTPDLGMLRTALRDSDEQSASLRYEKAGASAVCRVGLCRGFIGVGISLLDGFDLAGAANRVESMALTVVENVIGIAGDFDAGNHVT